MGHTENWKIIILILVRTKWLFYFHDEVIHVSYVATKLGVWDKTGSLCRQ